MGTGAERSKTFVTLTSAQRWALPLGLGSLLFSSTGARGALGLGAPAAVALSTLGEQGVGLGFGDWLIIGVPGAAVAGALAWGALMLFFPSETRAIRAPPAGQRWRPGKADLFVVVVSASTALGFVKRASAARRRAVEAGRDAPGKAQAVEVHRRVDDLVAGRSPALRYSFGPECRISSLASDSYWRKFSRNIVHR